MKRNFKSILSISVLALTLVLFSNCNDKEPSVDPQSGFETTFSTIDDYLAANKPEAARYTKDASAYITFTTPSGMIFNIPNGSFKDASGNVVNTGNVDIDITEYNSKSAMVFGGVTTTSGNTLLESAGMFNIAASQNGQDLSLVDGRSLYVNIPKTGLADPDMRVFSGSETTQGGEVVVDWTEDSTSWVTSDSLQNDTGGFYYLSLDFLSWCNLDKYYNATSGAQVRVKMPTGYTSANTTCYMIFEENSVVYLFGDAVNEEFNSGNYILPIGWDIDLLTVHINDDKELEYALINSTITDPHLETVTTMTKITEEDLTTLIEGL